MGAMQEVAAGFFEGTFTYGRRYLEQPNVVELDPYHLKLTYNPLKFTMLKGIPGALRDTSPDAWGRKRLNFEARGGKFDPLFFSGREHIKQQTIVG